MYAKFAAWWEKFKDNLADMGRQHGGRFTVVVAVWRMRCSRYKALRVAVGVNY